MDGSNLGPLVVSPADPRTIYVVKAGFVKDQKLYITHDGGSSWDNISGNLPNVPINHVLVDPAAPGFVYVANNYGVYQATDGGGSGAPPAPAGIVHRAVRRDPVGLSHQQHHGPGQRPPHGQHGPRRDRPFQPHRDHRRP
jgi:hypothetical protein